MSLDDCFRAGLAAPSALDRMRCELCGDALPSSRRLACWRCFDALVAHGVYDSRVMLCIVDRARQLRLARIVGLAIPAGFRLMPLPLELSSPPASFRPSQVYLPPWELPLGDTFGRAELEYAAAVLVLAMRDAGDVFRAVPLELVICATAMVLTTEPLHWMRNPFCRPDLGGFVARGWGMWSKEDGKDAIAFTEAALERLRRHVVS